MCSSTNYQKYQSKNPLRQYFLKNFLKKIINEIILIKPQKILDAGCGEGIILDLISQNLSNNGNSTNSEVQLWGIDISKDAIQEAEKRIPVAKLTNGSINSLPYTNNYFDLVVCSEVLEHLKNPSTALNEINRVAKSYLLFSVPNEPWFRLSSFLSGKYLRTLGNHPEHLWNWSKQDIFSLLSGYFTIEKLSTSFPWTILLCSKKKK